MNSKSNVKAMIDASILTSIFIVLTLVSSSLGLGFLGYYDFVVPIFFAIIFIKVGGKYGGLSLIVSAMILFFILGNPITSIMVVQGAILGFSVGIAITRFNCIGDEIVFISVVSLFVLFVFDFILRSFTNVSIVSNFGEVSKEISQTIDSAIKIIKDNGGKVELLKVLESYKLMMGTNFFKQIFYFNFGLMSFGNGFIVYFLSIIIIKKLNFRINRNSYKLNLASNMKKNMRLIFLSKKIFLMMLVYVLFIEILKVFKFETGLSYIDGKIYSIEYIFMIFTFKDAVVIVENKMIAERGNIKSVRLYRGILIVMLLINPKLMYFAAILNYVLNDRRGEYRNLFERALNKNLSYR